jgi:RNA processing factor Prp31
MFGSGTPRYASPVYISVIKDNDKYKPIITTLHNTKSINDTKLRQFKEAIL